MRKFGMSILEPALMVVKCTAEAAGCIGSSIRSESEAVKQGGPLLDYRRHHLRLALNGLPVTIPPERAPDHFGRQIWEHLCPYVFVAFIAAVPADDVPDLMQDDVFLVSGCGVFLVQDVINTRRPNPQAECSGNW